MRKLSTKRRHRLAGPIVLLLGLLVTGGAYASIAPSSAAESTATSTSDVEAGRQLFVVGCASCHGLNAEGVTTGTGTSAGNYGPSLIGVGAAAVNFQVGTGRMPMARVQAQAPRSTPTYNSEEIAQLGAYIASLAPGPAVPLPEQYDWQSVDKEGIARGGEFFRTNCTACHNSVGAGGALPDGKYAPNLYGVQAQHIYEAMLTGPQQMPVFSDSVLTPDDKREIIAYIKTVQDQPSYGGVAGGGVGPVMDGVFAWIAGIGVLVGFAIWIGMHGTRVKKSAVK